MNIKKIIARRGLVILGLVAIGCIVMATPELYFKSRLSSLSKIIDETPLEEYKHELPSKESKWESWSPPEKVTKAFEERENIENWKEKIRNIGLFIVLSSYLLYFIIRFIIWAIRTLKNNNSPMNLNKDSEIPKGLDFSSGNPDPETEKRLEKRTKDSLKALNMDKNGNPLKKKEILSDIKRFLLGAVVFIVGLVLWVLLKEFVQLGGIPTALFIWAFVAIFLKVTRKPKKTEEKKNNEPLREV